MYNRTIQAFWPSTFPPYLDNVWTCMEQSVGWMVQFAKWGWVYGHGLVSIACSVTPNHSGNLEPIQIYYTLAQTASLWDCTEHIHQNFCQSKSLNMGEKEKRERERERECSTSLDQNISSQK